MPVMTMTPGQSPEAPGTIEFYKQGAEPATGVSLTSEGGATFPGAVALTGAVSMTGEVTTGGVRAPAAYPAKGSTTTVANSTAETILHTLSIPAGDALVGTAYRMRLFGLATWPVTTVPTITFRLRLGGGSGAVVATVTVTCPATAGTSKGWTIDADLTVTAVGASANWRGSMDIANSIATAVQDRADASGAGVTRSSLQANDVVVTAQWSAASASNSMSCTGAYASRQA